MTIPGKGCFLLYIYGLLIFNIGFILAERNEKAFSLFSVVTFKNEECTSETTFVGGAVKGTCYSATECSDKSGQTSGNCASGFGVCCIQISNVGTATITENRTYLQSLLYPAIETATAAITYTINKMQSDICQVRLDFDNFAIAGPTATDETGGVAATYTNCADSMTTTLTSNAIVPVLCGTLTGQHLYLDVGVDASNTASLAFAFAANPTAATAFRSWRIKTSQIQCWATYRAPDGCHQYHYGSEYGKIWSPNFRTGPSTSQGTAAANNPNYAVDLMGLDLKICVRREKGMCCTLFQVCVSDPDGVTMTEAIIGGAVLQGTTGTVSPGFSFSIDFYAGTVGTAVAQFQDVGLVDEDCTTDYVSIPDSSTGIKNFGAPVQANTRYCGHRFGYVSSVTALNALSHAPVWDCTEPWEVLYHTDIYNGELDAANQAADAIAIIGRGMCLLYKQEAC